MLLRHKYFQFMFAVATAHEICHAFLGYISQNGVHGELSTPPNITHLDYGRPQNDEPAGESGRWFENALFGGSLEFYYDPTDDMGQVSVRMWFLMAQPLTKLEHQTGIPHLLDENEVAWKIRPQALLRCIEGNRGR